MNAEEFIRHYKWDVEYKARLTSGEYVMHSPFDDKECKKKPTMSINAETGKWQCFRSGEAGGNLKSLMFKLGLIEMREPAKTHVFVSPTEVKSWQVALLAHKEAMSYLTETRGLLKSSILQFKLGYKLESGKSAIIIPIFDETEACVGYKADFFKRADSQKYQKLKGTKTQLFNLHRIDLNQPVYITEGEYDAISLYQYGFTNVGSVPNGAQGISEWADVLEEAHQVYICFDNDGPGEEGADKLAQKIGRSKCYRVYCKLKDFNECLQCGMSKEDVQANIGSAHAMFNPPVTDIDAYLPGAYKILDNPEEAAGFTTGWKGLDNILGGIRLGEVTASSGFTGDGKTTFALALASNVIQSSNLHTLIVSPEMREQKLLIELAANYHRKQIETHEELDSFLDKFRNYISIAKVFDQWTHKGSKASLLDQVFDTLEYSIRNKGTQFIILDHLRLFVNTEQADGERLMIDSFVKRCIHTAVAHNVHIWLIVQPKHVDEASLARCKKCSKVVRKRINRSDFKGSSSIGQDVHNIVLVHRFKKEYCDCIHEVDGSLVEVEVAKNRDTGLEGTVSLEFDMDSRANYIELEE